MEKYIVGGYVRDSLLRQQGCEIEPKDRDWVVVGSSPEEMEKAGFVPVGADFPVFIDPQTGEEYALARTERKSGSGYHGFVFYTAPTVTLKEDLHRRDLTINAMAFAEDGSLIDYYGGTKDLEEKVFRHVGPAFSEDPVRLLRLARFAARFPTFTIAPETDRLLKDIVISGEADHLVPERIAKEFLRALEEPKPSRFFEVLKEVGYWEKAFGAWRISQETLDKVDAPRQEPVSLQRFVLALSDVQLQDLSNALAALRVPKEYIELAKVFVTLKDKIPSLSDSTGAKLEFLKKADAKRRPERFELFLSCIEDKLGKNEKLFWQTATKELIAQNVGSILEGVSDKSEIPRKIQEANLELIRQVSDKFAD